MFHYLPDREEVSQTTISTVEELGQIVRDARKANGLDQATAAGLAGVGVRFLGDLERGKPNLRIALVLQVLDRLGLTVTISPRAGRR
jgi:HTH-type transcriptional regulator/antitoxin HipB